MGRSTIVQSAKGGGGGGAVESVWDPWIALKDKVTILSVQHKGALFTLLYLVSNVLFYQQIHISSSVWHRVMRIKISGGRVMIILKKTHVVLESVGNRKPHISVPQTLMKDNRAGETLGFCRCRSCQINCVERSRRFTFPI